MDKEELQGLRQELNPGKPSHLSESTALLPNTAAVTSTSSHKRMQSWSEDREAMMTRNLRWLKEQIVRANLMAKEAGFKAEELNKNTKYLVILQITAANLNANRKREVVLSEPAVQVRRKGKGKQIWALEKMENRLVDMRELYQESKDFDEDNHAMWAYFKRADPFFDEQENHSLIGVANVFLACLINDVKLQYAAPIINQKGEVAGRLHVEVWRGTEGSDEKSQTDAVGDPQERKLDCVVKILQASGLPRHLSNFVFCEYHFWGQEEPVFIPPEVAPSSSSSTSRDPQCNVVFDNAKEFSVPVTEDFVEFLAEGAVAIEVYGHKKANYRRNLALWDLGVIQAKTRSLKERWSEVTRQLEMWVQVMELNEAGEFTPVEVLPAKDVHTGGIFQLQQGQSRRVQVEVRSVPDSGTMPLIATSILSVSIGDVMVRQACLSKDSESQWSGDEEMDSYQEVDLERMRKQWLDTLTQRQEYLDQQLQKIVCKPDKSEDDVERESQLLECRLTLTEERNAVLVPSPGSGIPGAPGERVPVPGMETHIPVLFLDVSADDFQSSLSAPLAGGLDTLLSREDSDGFFDLHVAKHYDPEVKVEASWDSTVHECPQLSRVMSADQRVYLTVSAGVQLSHPAHMQLVLRKRICVNVTGRQGFAQSLLKRISQRSTIPGCGVTFEIVSNIPGDIHGPEDREMLARLAASTEDGQSADSEAAIEKYLRSVLAVENIITLDRLRQEVAVKEQLAVRGKACLSSPNINQGWESHHNLSAGLNSSRRTLPISHSLHTETVKAVPKLLKSLLPGWKEDSRTQTIVHQQVLIEEIFPRDLQKESPISVPLPPPIIPETEESTPSPVSEVSSGYISTSLSTVTLSDVYRLSWDLPPWSSSGAYGFEALPDDEQEDNKYIYPESSLMDQSEPLDLLVVLDNEATEQRTDLTPSKPDNSPNDSSLSQQEPNQSPSLQLKEQGETNLVAKSDQLCQAKQKQDSIYHAGSEQLHKLASLTDSLIEEENETKQTHVSPTDPSRLNTLLTEELELIAKEQKDSELPLCHSPSESNISESQPSKEEQTTINSAQDPAADLISNVSEDIPSSSPLGDFVFPALSEKQATFEATKPNASSIPTPSPTTEVPAPVSTSPKTTIDPDLSLSSIQGSKSFSSVANPFKIKKVKSSDLKSFQRIIGKDKDSPVQVELSSSVGAELHLSVPMESLEMISDSEEGDASAKTVLPEWLKEGEFVTVGTNKSGTVRYVGPTSFAEGTWVGVELEVPAGKNDGSVGGKYYFHCNPGYGVLVRPNRVGLGGTKRHRQQHPSANLSGSSPNLAALTVLAKGESVGASVYHGRGKNRKSWNT